MPSSLIEPTGMAPGAGDETLSPRRGLRHDDGERVAGSREVLPGPVLVGYDGTPEAALVARAAACAAGGDVVVMHCWRSLDNPRDTALALRSCVHPQAVARVLEVVREHDAAALAAAERALATRVGLAHKAGAQESGICWRCAASAVSRRFYARSRARWAPAAWSSPPTRRAGGGGCWAAGRPHGCRPGLCPFRLWRSPLAGQREES